MKPFVKSIFKNKLPALFAAPMQGVSDYPWRTQLEQYSGVDVTVSQFIQITGVNSHKKGGLRDVSRTYENKNLSVPLISQFITIHPEGAASVARRLFSLGAPALDLNMGCPSSRATNRCSGAGALRNLDTAANILMAMQKAVPLPISAKIRIGIADTSEFNDTIDMLKDVGVDFVTVHARTAKEGNVGGVHEEYVTKAVEILECPVVFNGGITQAKDVDAIALRTGARGVMIGTGAGVNPWIFTEVKTLRAGGKVEKITPLKAVGHLLAILEDYASRDFPEKTCMQRLKQHIGYMSPYLGDDGRLGYSLLRTRDPERFFERIKMIK